MAIRSFKSKATQRFFESGRPRKVGWANVANVAKRKLDMVHYAAKLDDLKSPPGNQLETLSKDLAGKHSIRINNQWRVVFRWTAAGPEDVEIVDYH